MTRPTDYVYAKLAQQVYYTQPNDLPPGWQLKEVWDQTPDASGDNKTTIDGYFGAAYIHEATKKHYYCASRNRASRVQSRHFSF